MLYEFCEAAKVAHARCGKLIVATTESEIPKLEALHARARANGVEGLTLLDAAQAKRIEPHIAAAAALHSPATGIVSPEDLVRALERECLALDVAILRGTRLAGGSATARGFELATERERIHAEVVVNAAGLYADDVSAMLGGSRFTIYPCRGEYAELARSKQHLIRGAVYPLPHASGHGLGVHFTPTTGGAVLVGPTARYQSGKDDYEKDRLDLAAFAESARALMPALTIDDLRPSGSGIRAKLHPPDQSFADFLIDWDASVPGLIHVAGIDSPGLTACLAVGERVAQLARTALAV
jgi:L-2-hydroxyglutarate oxidase LhgO